MNSLIVTYMWVQMGFPTGVCGVRTDMLTEDTNAGSSEKEFLYREGCYYNNKSMHALYAMKSNFDKVFSYNLDEVRELRLGTFQLSDIFYNTVGGVIGGVCYLEVIKVRKHL